MKIGQDQTLQPPTRLGQNAGWMGLLVLIFVLGIIVGAQGWHNNIVHSAQAIPALSDHCYGGRLARVVFA